MLATMAAMQEEHNLQVHPEWRTQGYEYYRAIWVECAELLDHFGWKWWKHQTPDLEQSRLELVDIWHFGLSELIRDDSPLDGALEQFAALESLAAQSGQSPDAESFRASVEALALATLQKQTFSLPAFVAALKALPMGFQELFEMYIGKNVLNRFRQSHGYKEGTYQKLWQGREDNEHLIEVLAEVPVSTPEYVDVLFDRLEARYTAQS
jgi:hypothetical protein